MENKSECFIDLKQTQVKQISDAQQKLDSKPAVYIIENAETGKMYVGSTTNVARRIAKHASELKRGVHVNKVLQADFDSCKDKGSYTAHVGYYDSVEQARKRERDILDESSECDFMLNIVGNSTNSSEIDYVARSHKQRTPEARSAKSENSKRNWKDPELRKQMIANMGENVTVNGSVREASRETGASIATIRSRLNDGICSLDDVKKLSRRVSVRGVIYNTVSEAADAHGIARNTMTYRLQNTAQQWSDHFYIE
jgi:group I intron endonuclease